MDKLLQGLRITGRFLVFLRRVLAAGVQLLIVVPYRLLYLLLLQELVWRWWLGYGERPFRVLGAVALVLLITSLLYWQIGTFVLEPELEPPTVGHPTWREALYYSLASFSALGYGDWVSEPSGWAKWVGAVQPFIGIISAVALSIALAQRMTR